MKKLFFDFKFVLQAYLMFFSIVLASIVFIPKGDEILWINQFQSPFLALFFSQITHLGEWIFIVIIALFLIYKKSPKLKYFVLGFLLQLVFSQFFKRLFDAPRPLKFFGEQKLILIENAPKLYEHSFPSGHTTTAFFVAFWLILFFRLKNTMSLFLILLAILVGISRMYLLAHFKEDVLFGSFIGVFSALLPIYLFEEKNKI